MTILPKSSTIPICFFFFLPLYTLTNGCRFTMRGTAGKVLVVLVFHVLPDLGTFFATNGRFSLLIRRGEKTEKEFARGRQRVSVDCIERRRNPKCRHRESIVESIERRSRANVLCMYVCVRSRQKSNSRSLSSVDSSYMHVDRSIGIEKRD